MKVITDCKKMDEEYAKNNPPDFITHANYVEHLNGMANDLKINYTKNIKSKISHTNFIDKKLNLIKLTLRGLEIEYNAILDSPEYAIVCVSWISVKAYYLLYNMCLIFKYLITGNKESFNSSHGKIIEEFKKYVEDGKLVFSQRKFNKLYTCYDILKWKFKSGANIRHTNVDDEERYMQIIKKLANYSQEEFKRKKKIKNLRKIVDKKLHSNFLLTNKIGICEFFYWYRIKANYRDLEYLNENIGDYKFKELYCNYYELTLSFYRAFKVLINTIAKIRFGKDIM